MIENLKRYDMILAMPMEGKNYHYMGEKVFGGFLKFSEVEEALRSASDNSAKKQSCNDCVAEDIVCIRCSRNEHVKDCYTTTS